MHRAKHAADDDHTLVSMPELMNGALQGSYFVRHGDAFPRPLPAKPLVYEYEHTNFYRACQCPS